MSDTAGPAPTGPTVEAQIAELSRISVELHRSLARGRVIRLGLFFSFLALAAITTWYFYKLGTKVRSEAYLNQLTAAAEKKITDNSDKYIKHLETVAKESTPALQEAFSAQAEKDTPVILKSLENEGQQFAKELRAQVEERMKAHCEAMTTQHEAIIQVEFPETKDKVVLGRVHRNFEKAFEQVAKHYYLDKLESQLNMLYDSWAKFPVASPPGKSGVTTEDQLVVDLTDLLRHKLTEPGFGMK